MRRRNLSRVILNSLFLLAFLLTPPAIRLSLHYGWFGNQPGTDPQKTLAASGQADLAALLNEQLRQSRKELQLVTSAAGILHDPTGGPGGRAAARYRIAIGDVLPFSSSSTAERTFCVSFYGLPAMRKDTTALAGDLLVGRLVNIVPGSRIGRVQSVLDPLFRSRFRCGADSGMLWGTGRTDADGFPLLEVHHLGKPPSFSVGQAVLTEGGDGVYPPGCLAGHILEMPGEKTPHAIVRSGIRLDTLRQVVLLEDMAKDALAQIEEGSE